MAYVICEPCISEKNSLCISACPVDAIHPTQDQSDYNSTDQLFIDPVRCIDCGWCVDVCPTQAIYAEPSVPSEWAAYIAKNADYFRHSSSSRP